MAQHEINAKDVALATGLSPSNFTEWKMGRCSPGYDAICKIAQFFGVTVGAITGDSLQIMNHADDFVYCGDLNEKGKEQLRAYKTFLLREFGKNE